MLDETCPHPSGIAVGPDHNLYVNRFDLETYNDFVEVLSPGGKELRNLPLPNNSGPQGIATGPDGALWITLAGADAIGTMTTNGTLTTYPLPTANALHGLYLYDNASTAQIIEGTNNDLWFVEHNANKIGRITTGGVLTEYRIPTPHSAPSGISLCQPVSAKHECVWFAESAANKIGQLSL
ncbi:MAG TPA: hypothetical protein VKT72_08200 [Candidatus Baltobacteraceae bacterium]|nr:hypothetical protein [Candidatus Baltobacteraceae bacterium]